MWTERILHQARGAAVPLHVVARARRSLPRHRTAGLHPEGQSLDAPGRRTCGGPLQVRSCSTTAHSSAFRGGISSWGVCPQQTKVFAIHHVVDPFSQSGRISEPSCELSWKFNNGRAATTGIHNAASWTKCCTLTQTAAPLIH